jgi:hypothetical protein
MAQKPVGAPLRPFMYTLDQIATLLNLDLKEFKRFYVHYDQRSIGVPTRDKMKARNIAPEGHTPDWRIIEAEFRRWLRLKGFRLYERASIAE